MKGWFPWSLKPPHEGETCEEVEEQLDAAIAEVNEARAVLVRLYRARHLGFDPEMSTADLIWVLAGREPRQ